MKKFEYVIKDEVGIHARPAGLLVKEAKKYQSKVSITKDGKSAEATKLMALMGLGVKCGENVEVSVEGADEDTAFEGIFRGKSLRRGKVKAFSECEASQILLTAEQNLQFCLRPQW